LDAVKTQINLKENLFDLNPHGHESTNNGRPVLPIPTTLRPWLDDLSDGPLITYRWGRQISRSNDAALARASVAAIK
jgi:hypothetical protein